MIRQILMRLGLGERREHRRYRHRTLKLKTDQGNFESIDWSLGGCRIPAYEPKPAIGDQLTGVVTGIGVGNRGDFVAEVVRFTKTGEIGLRWLEMDPHTFMALAGLRSKSERRNK
jgi:hypothetical protein